MQAQDKWKEDFLEEIIETITRDNSFERLVGSRAEVEEMFDNKFNKVIDNLEESIKI